MRGLAWIAGSELAALKVGRIRGSQRHNIRRKNASNAGTPKGEKGKAGRADLKKSGKKETVDLHTLFISARYGGSTFFQSHRIKQGEEKKKGSTAMVI